MLNRQLLNDLSNGLAMLKQAQFPPGLQQLWDGGQAAGRRLATSMNGPNSTGIVSNALNPNPLYNPLFHGAILGPLGMSRYPISFVPNSRTGLGVGSHAAALWNGIHPNARNVPAMSEMARDLIGNSVGGANDIRLRFRGPNIAHGLTQLPDTIMRGLSPLLTGSSRMIRGIGSALGSAR